MHLSLKSVKSIAAALFGCALLALPVAAHATQTVESLYLNGTSPVTGHTSQRDRPTAVQPSQQEKAMPKSAM